MGKRAAIVFFVFCLFTATLILHLGAVTANNYSQNEGIHSSKSYNLSVERAPIYDCNGEKLTNIKENYYAAIKPTTKALVSIDKSFSDKELMEIHSEIKNFKPVLKKLDKRIPESDDVKVFRTFERYSENSLLAHVIGYVNSDGDGVTGLEKSYDELFKNNTQKTNILFPCNAKGRVLSGARITQQIENDYKKSGLYITIDKDIQEIAEKCMDDGNITVGAMVVVEPSTGKIKAMVSRPNFDPNNVAKSLNEKDSPLINRALCPFSVGSVFKPAIAACALEQNISPYIMYNCTGSQKIKNVNFNCYNHNAHGTIDMQGALENSCNCYFINLIEKMDIQETLSTLKAFGFSRETKLCEDLISKSGVLPSEENLKNPAARANFSFGQGDFLATPLQITEYMSTIASDGILNAPYLIEKTVDKNIETFKHEPINGKRVINKRTADLLKRFLQSAVENGNGRGAKLINTTSAGKTATAQTGVFKNGKELYNTWFSGFFPVDNPKYVVTVIKENGSLGASDCAPVFKMFADSITLFKEK